MIDTDREYKDEQAAAPEDAAYGAVDEGGNINAMGEDKEAAKSEQTGRVSKREVNELRAGGEVLEKRTRGRGKQNDAYKQERNLDEAIDQEEGAV
ncbi:hypothetical protein M0805_002203 [Coniferiporia weirii]|nr:hypothetical protein M0805_002203 [Coniferiporia weirii]